AAGDGAVVGEHTVGDRSAAAELHVDGPAVGPPPPEAAVSAVRLVAGEQGMADHKARGLRDEDAGAVRRSASHPADGPVVADRAFGDPGGGPVEDRDSAPGAADGRAAAVGVILRDRAADHAQDRAVHRPAAAGTTGGD